MITVSDAVETGPTFRGCAELLTLLHTHGFSVHRDHLRAASDSCDWLATRRIAALPCETNAERVQLCIRPFEVYDRFADQTRRSVEIDVTGEVGGNWFRLVAYSINVESLNERLPEIERRLIAAWNALHGEPA